MKLTEFNDRKDRAGGSSTESNEEIIRQLQELTGSADLARKIADHRPYSSVEDVLHAADTFLEAQDDEAIREAVRAHPRIGARTQPGSRSEKEQSAARTSDPQLMERLNELNDRYEEKFGQTFLICANGRRIEEILEELENRLSKTPAEEMARTREELRLINKLRIEGFLQ